MMKLTTFAWLGPSMIGAVGVASISWVVTWWSGRHDEHSDAGSRRKNSMEMPLRRGSLEERSLEESEERAERELAVCASFEESFREWQEHERASATTMEETTKTTNRKKNVRSVLQQEHLLGWQHSPIWQRFLWHFSL